MRFYLPILLFLLLFYCSTTYSKSCILIFTSLFLQSIVISISLYILWGKLDIKYNFSSTANPRIRQNFNDVGICYTFLMMQYSYYFLLLSFKDFLNNIYIFIFREIKNIYFLLCTFLKNQTTALGVSSSIVSMVPTKCFT